MKKHNIRIVGGDYRRTPVPVIDAPGLRPTPDRIRETLFNWLHHLWAGQFADKRVLDLFAGTGVLGFEAASRGVSHVQMVEKNPAAVKALRITRDKLKADQIHILQGDALSFIKKSGAPAYSLILLDPPFGQDWLDKLLPHLAPLLTPDGLVYIEAEAPIPTPPLLTTLRSSRAGQVYFALQQFAAAQKKDNNHCLVSI